MGQSSSSTAFQNSTQPLFSSRRSHHKPPSPIAAPAEVAPDVAPAVAPTPKSPTYIVAENKVLPNGVNDMSHARKLLRPVSLELSKVHPEFADIFQKPSNETLDGGSSSIDGGLNVSNNNKENSSVSLNASRRLADNKTTINGKAGHFRKQSISSEDISDLYKNRPTLFDPVNDRSHKDFDSTTQNRNVNMASNLMRFHSMGLSASQPANLPKHKRQISLASNPIQEHVIPEDPREHLYNPARDVPFSNFEPSMTSLPVKSSFDIDYSMQLTYAQLAEYRKIKRTNELEERTGKMLGELEAEISASSNVPKSPFDLQNRGVRSSTHSVSTRSSDTGISKSKKKKAPAPPVPQLATKISSVTTEPPPDYDTKVSPAVNYLQQAKFLHRSISSASKRSKPPAPQPFLKSTSTVSLSKPGSTASPTVLSARGLTESSATLPRSAPVKGQIPEVSTVGPAVKSTVLVQESIAQAKAQLEAMKKLQDILNQPASTEAKITKNEMSNASVGDSEDAVADLINVVETETALNNGRVSKETNGYEPSQTENINREEILTDVHQTKLDQSELQQIQPHHSGNDSSSAANVVSHSISTIFPEDKETTKRIDPLLQKDIILAALARQTKSEIRETTSNLPKSPPSESLSEKAGTNTTEVAQHNDSASNTVRSENYILQTHEEKVILRPDVLAETKNLVSSDFENRSSTTISIKSAEFWRAAPVASSHDKYIDKLPQLDNSLDQEDRSSSMSVDFSKRSSIQSENMSISSSNASGRVFSPDWAPEHDLDSEDDIMDSTYVKTEQKVSSEGFKVSVVPPKVGDLYETTKNTSHKRSKKRKDTKEADISPTSDKSKFGSLRKFKKNVHQGMKNAFGSISKASGTILNKQKSQDLHDNTDTSSYRQSAEFSNDVSASFRNPNWTLSRSVDESLHRRTLSDGFFNQRSVNILEHSDVSDHSEDDLGDIDFAGGLNDLPKRDSNSRRPKSAEGREIVRKRTSDEQANSKRQIVTAEYHGAAEREHRGENSDMKVNGHAMKDDGEFQEYSSKFHKEKKQDMKESASRKQENNKLKVVLAKMIAEKELQYESEILRRQEIENSFRRLRDLEDKELLQLLQKEAKHEEIRKLQQQWLQKEATHEEIRKLQKQRLLVQTANETNNNDFRMLSLSKSNLEITEFPLNNSPANNLNSSTTEVSSNNQPIILTPLNNLGDTSSNTGYVNANQLSLPFQYLANGNVSFLQTGYVDSPFNFQNIIGVQQSCNLPSLSTTAIGHSVSPVAITNVNYVPPLLSGGGFSDGFTNNAIPKLTQQELIYLGQYMRMIGVPPPANNHEWAVLLNSVGYKTSTLPLTGQNLRPMSFPVATNNPDLSSLLRNQNFQNDHTSKLIWQIADVTTSQQPVQSNKPPPQILHSNETTTVSQQLQNFTDNPSLTPEYSQDASLFNNKKDTTVIQVTETYSEPLQSVSSPSTEAPVTVNTTKSVITINQLPTLAGHQVNTSTDTITKSDSQIVNSESFPQTVTVASGTLTRTNILPAKVYAPLGFRPVAFNPSSR